ncbi:MAG: heparinase II/III family protein [Candidatus Brocadiia bacterium]
MRGHPRLLVKAKQKQGFRSVDDLREACKTGHAARLWEQVQMKAQEAATADPLTAYTPLEGRSEEDIKQGNREYVITNAAGRRVLACALAALLTGEEQYGDAALRQVECLFDEDEWPEWQDIYHRRQMGFDADLRTGMLCRDLGLAFDWLHPMLTDSQREWFVEGVDRRGIQPYLRAIQDEPWWLDRMNNWTTCIVGGLGICGMALAEDHEQSERLIELAMPRMKSYLERYGPDGEFNENPAYAGSTGAPVIFFSVWRYFGNYGDVSEQLRFFKKHCIWQMYVTVPPGVIVPFGDGGPDRPASFNASFFPAVAAATRDPVLQWYYLQHANDGTRYPILELLYYDATLEVSAPTPERYPLGRIFPAHSGIVSSRTSWDQENADCVVVAKAGHGGINHTHPDAGQVTIRGYGHRLIRDLGKVHYPGGGKQNYYHFSSSGHNVLTFDEQELIWDGNHRSHIVRGHFDNQRGGFWTVDTTELYEDAKSVQRSVVHLLPGIVVVLDSAQFDAPGMIRIRWHPETATQPDENGCFVVRNEPVALTGRIISPGGEKLQFSTGHHKYEAPHNRDRMGNLLPQRHEPYLDASTESDSCSVLSLFAVYGPDSEPGKWATTQNGWGIDTPTGSAEVKIKLQKLTVARAQGESEISVDVPIRRHDQRTRNEPN